MRVRVLGFAAVLACFFCAGPAAHADGARDGDGAKKVRVAQAKGSAKSAPAKSTAKATPGKGAPAKSTPKKPAKKVSKPTESKKPARRAGQPAAPADSAVRTQIAGQTVVEPPPSDTAPITDVDKTLFGDLSELTAPVKPAVKEPEARVDPKPSELEWMAKLAPPDLPFHWDVRLIRYLDYFKNTTAGKNFVAGLLKRSGRYEDKLREALKSKGLPEDLVYLSLVESAMNPRIVSHAGAAGLWQFMPQAGTAYGLRIDRTVDERLDPERSTAAATKFLSDLHKRFGRWELAMAAYNMGHGGLLTSIRKYNTNDFWELSELEAGVPYETALYVPKILAIAFVARNRAAFDLENLTLDAPEKWTTEAKPLASANAAKNVPAKPPTTEAATKPAAVTPAPSLENTVAVTIRWGESLDVIARGVGTTESKLRKLNGLTDPTAPRPGTVIRVPSASSVATERLVAVVPARASQPAGTERVFYEVVWGDKLSEVARVLEVTEAQLMLWNNLDKNANLHGRMVLQAFVTKLPKSETVRFTKAVDAMILVLGSTEFFDFFEAKNGRTRFTVTTKQGDTFAGIAKRHGLTVGMLERINHRSRSAELPAGETLVVYGKTAAGAKPAKPEPSPAVVETPVELTRPSPYDDKDPNESTRAFDEPLLQIPIVP